MSNPPATSSPTSYGALRRDDNFIANGWTYKNIAATTAGTVVKAGPGILHTMVINTPGNTSVVTLYDNPTSATGTPIATVTMGTSHIASTIQFDVTFTTGLTVSMATANSDITLNYI